MHRSCNLGLLLLSPSVTYGFCAMGTLHEVVDNPVKYIPINDPRTLECRV